jgi:hypothetical protein
MATGAHVVQQHFIAIERSVDTKNQKVVPASVPRRSGASFCSGRGADSPPLRRSIPVNSICRGVDGSPTESVPAGSRATSPSRDTPYVSRAWAEGRQACPETQTEGRALLYEAGLVGRAYGGAAVAVIAQSEDFVSKMRYLLKDAGRPITFIVGSGLTRGNVPGVESLVRAMRASLEDDRDQRRFDSKVAGPSWGDKYQQAAEFLFVNRDQQLLNRIIRTAVLGSCKSISKAEMRALLGDEAALRQLETDPRNWSIDAGVEALGSLLASMPNDVRGRVITTNFDPHIEIAVRRAGGRPLVQWLDTDGRLSLGEDAGNIEVVHVHGFWRRGDTLHTVHQLTTPRPQFGGSLREALKGHAVVVVGYSGWPDAFSNSLRDRVSEGQYLGMSLIWCHFGEVKQAIEGNTLLETLSTSNAAAFYEQVDANKSLPHLLAEYRRSTPDSALPSGDSLPGWTRIEPSFLSLRAQTPGRESDSARFFDGAEPTWRVALDSLVPALALARELERSFREASKLIVAGMGPMGEGKSLAIRQVAARIGQEPGAHVLWREPGTRLIADEVLRYANNTTEPLILVTDDADLVIEGLIALSAQCSRSARTDIRVVLVASEREWRNAGGFRRLASNAALVPTAPLTLEDAQLIVNAWASVEGAGLGEMSSVPEGQRAEALRARSADSHAGEKGSLIGAMLSVRFGDTLPMRVENLLSRLDRHSLGSESTLADAFLMVCLLHSTYDPKRVRTQPASLRVLAAATGLPVGSAPYLITEPLGREAAVSVHGERVWARHIAIANAALAVSRKRNPDEIPSVIAALVRGAIGVAPENRALDDDLYAVAYLSRLLDAGPEAVLAARAACAAAPRRMTYVTSLMAALREANRPEEALAAGKLAWSKPDAWLDSDSMPYFLLEWGTDAGMSGFHSVNVILAAMALNVMQGRDSYGVEPFLMMGVGFASLHLQTSGIQYCQALAGAVFIASEFDMSPREEEYLSNHQRYLRRAGISALMERAEALEAIQTVLDSLQSSPPHEVADFLKRHPVSVLDFPSPEKRRAG